MEGVLFSSYNRDEPTCQIQRKPGWEFGDMSYLFRPFSVEVIQVLLKKLWCCNMDIECHWKVHLTSTWKVKHWYQRISIHMG